MATLGTTTINNTLTVAGNMNVTGTVKVVDKDVETKISLLNTLNTRLNNLVGKAISCSVSYTNASNWTVSEASAYLIGNAMRFYFKATRSAAISGNITNQDIATFTVNHGGRIAQCLAMNFTNGASGGMASHLFNDPSISGNNLTFKVRISAVAQSTTTTNGYAVLPVRLNTSYY